MKQWDPSSLGFSHHWVKNLVFHWVIPDLPLREFMLVLQPPNVRLLGPRDNSCYFHILISQALLILSFFLFLFFFPDWFIYFSNGTVFLASTSTQIKQHKSYHQAISVNCLKLDTYIGIWIPGIEPLVRNAELIEVCRVVSWDSKAFKLKLSHWDCSDCSTLLLLKGTVRKT